MILHRSATACLALIACACAGNAAAQTTDQWRVTVTPYVWATSMDGRITLAGHRAPVDVPFSDAFEQLESVVMGDVEIQRGRWGAFADYQYAKTGEDISLLGLPATLGTRTTTVSGGLRYRIIDEPLGGRTASGDLRSLRVEPIVGARWSKLRADLATPVLSTNKGAEWTDLLVGLRVEGDVTDRWTLRTQIDAGGLGNNDRNSVSWQALASYRTSLGQGAVSLNAGYRMLQQNYEQDDFTGQRFDWKVSRHGPVLGLSLTY